MTEELQERDYLALSAIVDTPDNVLRFDNIGDIPTWVIGRLYGMDLVYPTYIGWRSTAAGFDRLYAYRQPAPASPDAVTAALPSDGDIPVLPGSPLDKRLLAAAEGDSGYSELAGQIKRYERALLECITQMNKHGNDDNWETVTMEYAQAIKDGRKVLEAQQPASPSAGFTVGQAVIILDGTSSVGKVTDKSDRDMLGQLRPIYLVSVDGNTGWWYSADELTAAGEGE